ncbi:putative transporter svop-1 isoform X2 [Rhopilema esculentum]
MEKAENVRKESLPNEQNSITINEAISLLGIGKAQYLLLLLTAGGYFAFCTELLVFVFLQDAIAKEWKISDETFALLPLSTSITSVVGGFVFAFFSDRKGRRLPYAISLGIACFFAVASAFAPNFWSFVLLRSLGSFGGAGMFSIIFVYLLEFLPTKGRGKFMVIANIGGSLGVAYTAGLAWILIPRQSLFLFLILCAVPLLILFLIRFGINVESPRFLLSVGEKEQAIRVLEWVSIQNKAVGKLDGFRIACVDEVSGLKKETSRCNFGIFSREVIVQTFQLSFIWLWQSYGYWGVTSFYPKYLSQYGVPSFFIMFMNICAQLPGSFMAILLIDNQKFGRLHTMQCFSFCSVVVLFLAVFLRDQISISVLSVATYFFIAPIYAVLQTYIPECYPTSMRSTIMSLLNLISTIPGTTAAFIGAELLSLHKHWLYPCVWGTVFALQFLLSLTLRKETAQLSLENEPNINDDYVGIRSSLTSVNNTNSETCYEERLNIQNNCPDVVIKEH